VKHLSSTSESLSAAIAVARQAFQSGAYAQVTVLLAEQPPEPDVLELLGLAWAGQRQWDKALPCQQALVEQVPGQLAAWINLANTQAELGQLDTALVSLARAETIDPAHPAVHFNRGNVQAKRQAWQEAVVSFDRTLQLVHDHPDPQCNRAVALRELRRLQEARTALETVLAQHPKHAQAWNLLGTVLHRQGDDALALQAYQRAAALMPGLADAYGNAAQVLARVRRYEEAIACARRAVSLDSADPAFRRTLGIVLDTVGQREEAQSLLEDAHRLDPDDPIALSSLLDGNIACCDWDKAERHLAQLRALWAQGRAECQTLWRLLSLPLSRQELKRVTEASTAAQLPPAHPWPVTRERHARKRPARLRIGYFSADFHRHATSILMAGLFEAHDKSRFETVGFCLGRYDGRLDDQMRRRVRTAFDRFETVNELTPSEIATKARSLDIHVAVDLKGHTRDNRQAIFSHRAAPIQMHYIGYPGTLGMPGAIDYLVADPVLVPPEMRADYSEKIIILPDSYQVNDRQRVIADDKPSRTELGLPEHGFVFCCFNNYKITRDLFRLWMKLLQARPGSVLWLLEDNATAAANLRAAAVAAGIEAHRLVFAQRLPLPEHLARHAQADLFLDTLYCNAHTTASDALWAGLPVLTCAGATFASRVGASLLTACGLPELITDSHREYLDLALALSADPARLQALRQRLESTRLQVPLFDTERFTRHIERAYDLAWERFERGLPPDHITVPSID
jgi:predicted O-linked N-acetylglucosamine transferase (SPINDLY family)